MALSDYNEEDEVCDVRVEERRRWSQELRRYDGTKLVVMIR